MTAQSIATRKESDALGEVTLAGDCLYGVNTARGRENFAISHRTLRDNPAFIRALARVKKAAALANSELSALPQRVADAVIKACDEILEGLHHEHFVIDMLEGSGGTSINMNANEVIANRALQIIGASLGDYRRVHPNDHVNMGQSRNDVVPTALKVAVFEEMQAFLRSLDGLGASLAAKSIEFSEVLRLGRTCLQSAQPMTLGQQVAADRSFRTAHGADGRLTFPRVAVSGRGPRGVGSQRPEAAAIRGHCLRRRRSRARCCPAA